VTTISFTPATTKLIALGSTVYLKSAWLGDWEEETHLYATDVEWKANPTIPTATLGIRDYGRGKRQGETTHSIVSRLTDRHRWWVKIVISTQVIGGVSDDLTWYGTLEIDSDNLLGVRDVDGSAVEQGEQTFTCYGIEKVLDDHIIHGSTWRSESTKLDYDIDVAPDFNQDGIGNRAANKSLHCYEFTDARGADQEWTTKDIVEYLLEEQVPLEKLGVKVMLFELNDPTSLLPFNDAPVVPQDLRSTWEILNELMSASKLVGFRLVVASDEITVELQPFTYVDSDFSDGTTTIKANPRVRTLNFERDPDASASVKLSTVHQYDQVILRGARRRICCSISFVDSTVEIGWSSALETEYEDGGSNDANYPAAAEVAERQRWDAEARSQDRLLSVYSRFALPDDWDRTVSNGIGGSKYPAFPEDDDFATAYPANPHLIKMLPHLPLKDGHDYESFSQGSDISTFSVGPFSEHPPMVFCPQPEDTEVDLADKRWVQLDKQSVAADVEKVDEKQDRTWSVRVEVPDDDYGFLVEVRGAPQHAIAYDHFSGQTHDKNGDWGQYDYEDFVFTVAFEDQRYCEARYPDDADVEYYDMVRRRIKYLGDGYRLDFVATNTMWAVHPETGAPLWCPGGNIRDDSAKLLALAKRAYSYLSVPRRGLSFQTHKVNSAIQIGDFIDKIGSEFERDINGIITSITVSLDSASEPGAAPATIQYETSFVDLEQLQIV